MLKSVFVSMFYLANLFVDITVNMTLGKYFLVNSVHTLGVIYFIRVKN